VNIETDLEMSVIEFSYPSIHTYKFDTNESTLGIALMIDAAITDPLKIGKEIVLRLTNTQEVRGILDTIID